MDEAILITGAENAKAHEPAESGGCSKFFGEVCIKQFYILLSA